jgi:hypothetical protein
MARRRHDVPMVSTRISPETTPDPALTLPHLILPDVEATFLCSGSLKN